MYFAISVSYMCYSTTTFMTEPAQFGSARLLPYSVWLGSTFAIFGSEAERAAKTGSARPRAEPDNLTSAFWSPAVPSCAAGDKF